jgi:hypothetical protein
MKFVPLKAIRDAELPTASVDGEIEFSVGKRLPTVKSVALVVPPPGLGFVTVM